MVAAEAAQAILMRMENRVERRYIPPQHGNPLGARLLLFFARYRVPLLGRLVGVLYNSDIRCRIRSPILMPSPFGILVHPHAQIGSRVTLMQQVAIGPRTPVEGAAPVLEDEVFVGAGARVLGGIRIGRGAVIGANAVVTRDVPSYCTVVGANRVLRKRTHAANEAHEQLPEAGDFPAAEDGYAPQPEVPRRAIGGDS
jgi:hypothetical protein